MEVHRSARRHGVADDDTVHAVEHAIAWVELDDDPPRFLVVGPDRAGNLLEVVVLHNDDVELAIHAMPLRPSTRRAVFGDEG